MLLLSEYVWDSFCWADVEAIDRLSPIATRVFLRRIVAIGLTRKTLV